MTVKISQQLENASIDLFSSDKEKRIAARKTIVNLTDDFKKISELNTATPKRTQNWSWLRSAVISVLNREDFPYSIDEKKAGEIFQDDLIEQGEIKERTPTVSEKPAYLVNMPHASRPKEKKPLEYIRHQIELLKNEGFGVDSNESTKEANQRLRIVVGVNFCYSMDPDSNKAHKKYLKDLSKEFIPNVRFMGFSWVPVWLNSEKKIVEAKEPKRFFRLIKELDSDLASSIFEEVMTKKVIPYQRIREEIKNHEYTQSYLKNLRFGLMNRPCFLVTWDDDAVKVRTGDLGLFSVYDELIEAHPKARVLTTGYYMAQPGCGFVEMASRCDYVGRSAIGNFLASYPPEPNTLIAFEVGKTAAQAISFMRKGAERGKDLEAIGLLEYLHLLKREHHGEIVFGEKGAIQTAISPKVKIPKKHLKVLKLDVDDFEQVRSLRSFYLTSIRGTTFGSLVCRSLPEGYGKQTIKGEVAKMFSVFEPIEYIRCFHDWRQLYPILAKKFEELYDRKDEDYKPDYKAAARKIKDHHEVRDPQTQIENFLRWRNSTLYTTHEKLIGKGVSLKNMKIMLKVAVHTGEKLFQFLSHVSPA